MNIHKKYSTIYKIKSVGHSKLPLFVLVALLLTGCGKEDHYNTPHPDKGAVVLTTDWTNAFSESDIPATYFINIDGKAVQTSTKMTCYPELLQPGSHDLLVYNLPQGMTLEGETVTVNTRDDGTLYPISEHLFAAVQKMNVVKDDTVRITVPMRSLLCSLELNISMNGSDPGEIAQISATLSGVAASVNMRHGESGKESAVAGMTAQIVDNHRALRTGTVSSVQLRCRIPGVNLTARQILTLTIAMQDGYRRTITSDLTEQLKNINADMALTLDTTVEVLQDGDFTGGIKDWTDVKGDDVKTN